MPTLSDLVALVTGASRGAGRGIALELGAAGATVYVTGRSVEGGSTTDNVPALASDESVLAKSGQVLEAGTLATEYAFTDVDESQPPPFRIPAPK
jgi:NAD(P)-dependent dehydrogenase (short-subunit alcohol dehydrogenase family)